jgi:hypothetical protein
MKKIECHIQYLLVQVQQASEEGLAEGEVQQLQAYLGLAWVVGCCLFGSLVVQKSTECRIGRQYLCQEGSFAI